MAITLDDVRVTGTFRHANVISPDIAVSNIAQQSLQEYVLDFTNFRVWDAYQTVLPNPGLTDDLGIYGGTWGTDPPSLRTEDLKAAGATNSYARFQVTLPPEYVAGQTVVINVVCGMMTTVADTTATCDLVAHLNEEDGTLGADICATAATTMNTLLPTMSTIPFTITPATLSPGSVLDCRIHTAINDAAEATAVIGYIAKVALQCDTQG
jgi:hypothetical protein